MTSFAKGFQGGTKETKSPWEPELLRGRARGAALNGIARLHKHKQERLYRGGQRETELYWNQIAKF